MSRLEQALRVLRSRADFDLTEQGARVAQASARRQAAASHAAERAAAGRSIAGELRRHLHAQGLNPALLAELRRWHGHAQRAHGASLQALRDCTAQEEQARHDMTRARKQTLELSRAEGEAAQVRRAGCQAREAAGLDELWLMTRWRQAE